MAADSRRTTRLLIGITAMGVVLGICFLLTPGAASAQASDSDGDGLDDAWETAHFGDLSQGAADDPDGDGCDNACEESTGTDPNEADTDGDGLTDGEELSDGTDPLDSADPPAETPTPEPTEEPAAASPTGNTPVFHIEEWYTSPDDLQRGTEFDLGLKIRNVGTSRGEDILVTIGTSSDFFNVGDTERIGHINVGSRREVVLRVGIAPELAEGFYNIPVEISGYDVVADTRVTETRTIGVYVAGLSPDASTSAFNLDSWTIPQSLYAGAQFDLGITFTNIGTAAAEEVLVSIASNNDFVDVGTSPYFESIGVGETKTATLHVGVAENLGGDYYSIPVEVSFNNNTGQGNARLSDTRNIGVYVAGGGTSSEVSEFFLERYGAIPNAVSPGTSFQLQVVLVNQSSTAARNFFARLGQSEVVAPLGASNVQYLEQVEPGSSITLDYDLVVDGGAQAGLTTIDLNLEYEDIYGSQQQQTETITLAVVETPHLQIGLFDTVQGTMQVGDVIDVPVEVINIGSDQVNVNTVEVISSELSITDGTLYIGPLDAGSAGSLVASAEAVRVGPATIEVRVHYLDSFQQPQTITRTLTTIEVESPAPVPLDQAPQATQSNRGVFQTIWQAILGLLGLRTETATEGAADS